MVLAEFVRFKDGLYKSCGVEWFEGIMLEPCLLQPCFHVAGEGTKRATSVNVQLLSLRKDQRMGSISRDIGVADGTPCSTSLAGSLYIYIYIYIHSIYTVYIHKYIYIYTYFPSELCRCRSGMLVGRCIY